MHTVPSSNAMTLPALGLAAAAGACVLAGCRADLTRPARPELMIETADSASLSRYGGEEFAADQQRYRRALDAAAEADDEDEMRHHLRAARLARDIMINRVRADIRDHSGEFEDTLRQRIAEWSSASDTVELSLAAAATLAAGAPAKSALASILSAVKGTRISIDKNFFRERTSEAIIAAIRASRIAQDTAIAEKTATLDAGQYPFEEAWNDLVDLYYAGTLASGFQSLAEHAGTRATEARREQAELVERRTRLAAATPEQVRSMSRLYGALTAMTVDQALAIARRLGIDPGESPRAALQTFLRSLPPGDPRTADAARAYDAVLGEGGW